MYGLAPGNALMLCALFDVLGCRQSFPDQQYLSAPRGIAHVVDLSVSCDYLLYGHTRFYLMSFIWMTT